MEAWFLFVAVKGPGRNQRRENKQYLIPPCSGLQCRPCVTTHAAAIMYTHNAARLARAQPSGLINIGSLCSAYVLPGGMEPSHLGNPTQNTETTRIRREGGRGLYERP